MSIEQEIRNEIDNIRQLKIDVGDINNHLSILEGLRRERNRKAVDNAYQRGLDDAWEAARKIADMWKTMNNDELLEIFGITARIGESTVGCIFKKQTASEAITKLKAYEEQKADNKLKVGDEVVFHHDDGRPDTVVVVTYIGQDGFIDGMDGRGTQYAHKNPTKWTKTGRHFDIDKILEEMRS